MLTYIAIAVLVFVAGVLAYAATRPDRFRVSRSVRIAAPPERILPFIDDFHAWSAWSPYEKLDPAMKRIFSGPPRGVGAVYEWDGSGKAGAGRMEIVRVDAPSRVEIQQDFLRPFKARNVGEFRIEPDGDATRVTWGMDGPNLYISKVMGIFINMDHLIGKDFAVGLEHLKGACEQEAAAVATAGGVR